MNPIDLAVIVIYCVLTLIGGLVIGRSNSVESYLANNRSTGLFLLLCSTVATWVGAGATVGVASSAYTTGISFGISVILVNLSFFLIFSFFAARIKRFGDEHGAYTVGDYLGHFYGNKVRLLFALMYMFVGMIWAAVQLLAVGNLLVLIFGWSLTSGLLAALGMTLLYSLFGGLKSDILTDCFQFIVMIVAFAIMLPLAWTKAGGLEALIQLEPRYYDPTAFGGIPFLVGSAFIGCLYSLVNVNEWQRVFSAGSTSIAKKVYIYAIPFEFMLVAIAIILGLLARSLQIESAPDQALFELMKSTLPPGVLGLGYACIIALVMSSIDSLIIAATATLSRDLLPLLPIDAFKQPSMVSLRISGLLFGLTCAAFASLYPSIVDLTVLAAYVSLCFAPSILLTLLGLRFNPTYVAASALCSLLSLICTWPLLGKNSFVVLLIVAFGLLFIKGARAK